MPCLYESRVTAEPWYLVLTADAPPYRDKQLQPANITIEPEVTWKS